MTEERYRTIVVDPPWPLPWSTGHTRINGRGERHRITSSRRLPYATMSIEAIAALALPAEEDAHLYLWAPDRFVIDGSASLVCRAWGFDPLRFIVWRKQGFGLGTFPRPQHELLLVGRRGKLPFRIGDAGSVHDWRQPGGGDGRRHSAKPEGSFALIERASPGPYLEMFARSPRLGWDSWGDEAVNPVALPGLGA